MRKDIEKFADVIRSCQIFAHLQDSEVLALAELASTVELDPNQALLYRGDLTRDAYILISGKLAATTSSRTEKGALVGYIMPGEIVGEMSLLLDAPRSLTVTANTKSELLMIRYSDFHRYCHNNPEIAFKMVEVIVKRSQGVIKRLEKSVISQLVVLLPANMDMDLKPFIAMLKKFNTHPKKAIFLDENDMLSGTGNFSQFLLQLKQKSDNIIYTVNIREPDTNTEALIRYADKIVLVGEGNKNAYITPDVLNFLQSHSDYSHTHNELVLLYPNNPIQPQNTAAWLKQATFFRHHHIALNDSADIQRLTRFLTGTAIGLVLGGGGVKGWAHAGALKAILEANIPIDMIGGTSVGAIVGANYLTTLNFENFWEKYKTSFVEVLQTLSMRELTWPIISLLSGKSATVEAIKQFDMQIEDLPRFFFNISCNITQKEEAVHTQGKLWEILRATSSLPGVLPPMVIDKELHVDGGLVNNLPVDRMENFLENSGMIIAVSLSNLISVTGNYDFPPMLTLKDALLIKCGLKKQYHFPSFFYTFIDSLLMGSHAQQKINMKKADILIQPDLREFTIINRRQGMDTLMELGYRSAKAALEEKKDLISKFTTKS